MSYHCLYPPPILKTLFYVNLGLLETKHSKDTCFLFSAAVDCLAEEGDDVEVESANGSNAADDAGIEAVGGSSAADDAGVQAVGD